MNRRQIELFVADILDVLPKGDLTTMEHPVFALSTKPDTEIWEYTNGTIQIEVAPGPHGRPTIFDKDLLMYAISQVVEGMNRGRALSRRVRFVAYDFLVATGRGTGGKDYEALAASAERLKGVSIYIRQANEKKRRATGRGLIDEFIVESDGQGRMVYTELVLSEWIYQAITDERILTYNPAYYDLRKANERRLYEICRKFCGTQTFPWKISFEKLYHRFGTRASEKEFRRMLRELAEIQSIPDYAFKLEDGMLIVVYAPWKGKDSWG